VGAAPIEFWFDFSSAYAYFAAHEIEEVAARHDRSVRWRPYMLGTAFKVTGARGLSSTPLKKEYANHDWRRLARLKGIPFNLPQGHPMVALPATRAFYKVEAIAPTLAPRFAKAVLDTYYSTGLDTTDAEAVSALAVPLGLDPAEIAAGCLDPAIKDRARAASEEAVARGVFGSPWFFVDGEPFWGHDRLPMMDDWLRRGGW
jgi:2-hydroxychromene-2-carboxylate isomerase